MGIPIETGVSWAPVSWLALRATLGAVLSLRRPAFHVVTDRGPVEDSRVPAGGGVALAGAEFRWP
ncbi:MAG: hypothetical protein KDK70_20165 [Myxococcales bacterium]|nr:hypothetical protein [Myxococcales bacterium]